MSFRLRLTLFFVLIVVLPMVALAVLVSQIASDSANGKTDARLDAGAAHGDQPLRAGAARTRAESPNDLAREIADDPEAIAASGPGRSATCSSLARDLRRARRDQLRLDRRLQGRETVAGRLAAGRDRGGRSRRRPAASRWARSPTSTTTPRCSCCARSRRRPARTRRWSARRGRSAGRRRSRPGDLPRERRGGGPRARGRGAAGRGDRAARRRAGADRAVRAAPATRGSSPRGRRSRSRCSSSSSSPWSPSRCILRSLQGRSREMLGAARRIGEGDFSTRGAGQRQRRDGRAGERVQQDERPARRADGPAAPPAGRDREVGPADRRGVRLRARPPGAARDPGRDRGRRVRRPSTG